MIREIPWGEIGFITYKRTYARPLKDRTEELPETVERELKGFEKQLKLSLSTRDKNFYRKMRLNMKGSPAGRFVWQLGTKTVDRLGLASLQNCAFTLIDHPVRPFTWAMDMLMLGSGVGFSIEREYVSKLPKVKNRRIKIERLDESGADFIIPDTREGWIKLLGRVLKAYFYSGKGFTYSTQLIRGEGAPIKGFGGSASGPEYLVKGINQIIEILESKKGNQLSGVDCMDIMNIIGTIVVSGNVRRSAQLCIGDQDDQEYLQAKRWDIKTIPNWRTMSNNSVNVKDFDSLTKLFWDTYNQGEPYGMVNIDLSQRVGRLGESQYADFTIRGYNPCAEQGLADKETCCLFETFLCNITSFKELWNVVRLGYLICKHSLAMKCHLEDTEEIVHENMRMGIGMTGIMMASEEQLSWLDLCYKKLRAYDVEYSKANNWPVSVRMTTVKPSGTLSLLAGVTPGVHPSPAGPYYIRRVRISSQSDLVQVCKSHGYPVEYLRRIDKSNDTSTVVVSFPCKLPKSTPIATDVDVIDQLEKVKQLQTIWSDNSVSVTAYYNMEDIPRIKKYLSENWKDGFKTVSFLLNHGHGFDQAPYETITEKEYNKMMKNCKPIISCEVSEDDISQDQIGCEGGACPIK